MKILLVLISMTAAFSSFAGVNLKNGNYYISYTDVVVPGGGKDLEVTRTYNSKSTGIGWFGFGWGSAYETYLKVSADGSVILHENGSGALTRFTPRTAVNASGAADKIIAEMRKKTTLSEKVAKGLKKKLINDAELRHAYALQFKVEASIAKGTVLYSNQRGLQELHKEKDGYVRKFSSGKKEFFNKSGKLKKITYKSGHSINFNPTNRTADTELKSIKDSLGKQLFFEWYPDGFVKAIYSSKDKKATYAYKGKDLDVSIDLGGNKYDYDYDINHNLVLVKYDDASKMVVKYEPKTQFVSSIKKRSSEKTSYKYGADKKNPDMHYWTEVTKSGLTGKPVSNYYEYEIKTKPDGEQYTYRIVTKINGIKTETVYSECCGLPLKIQRGSKVTNFEYTKDGLLKKKTSTSGESIALSYDKTCKKVTKVVNKRGWTNFSYDKKCNLAKAINSKGKAVLLVYDRKSRITKMVDRNQKTKKQKVLTFKYNSMGKPVEIALGKKGKINVDYDNYGQIKKVNSKEGHKMALQVTRAFQNLLNIVKPAGVNLSL